METECSKCLVSKTCSKRGSSPLIFGGKTFKCRIVGGFGRKPIDKSVLSEESIKSCKENGPCLTVAEVPTVEDGFVIFVVTKIFSPPCLSQRETNVAVTSSDVTATSHK
jgi:hypothetical protein